MNDFSSLREAIIFLVDTMGMCSSVDADVYYSGIFAERERCKEVIKRFICELIDLL